MCFFIDIHFCRHFSVQDQISNNSSSFELFLRFPINAMCQKWTKHYWIESIFDIHQTQNSFYFVNLVSVNKKKLFHVDIIVFTFMFIENWELSRMESTEANTLDNLFGMDFAMKNFSIEKSNTWPNNVLNIQTMVCKIPFFLSVDCFPIATTTAPIMVKVKYTRECACIRPLKYLPISNSV